MADVDDYLEEGWDPRSVTMPRLRSILVTHSVDFPSTAKKAQLVQLVEDQVLPQAPKLRAQKARAKRSSMGIVNAGSAEDVNNWADQDLAPPPSTRRSKSPRKPSARPSTRVKSEEVDERAIFSPPKRASRSVSRALSHADEDIEPPTPRAARRTSRRTVTPSVKEESDSEPEMPADGDESVFTDDNVFQSGSSPPTTKTPRSNRRSSGFESSRSVQSSRRTTSGNTQLSVARQRPRRSTPFEEVEPTEEFTPEEQLELEEAASNGEVVMPVRQKARKSGGPGWFSRVVPPFILLLAALYATWYRQEKIAVGYCGLGRPAKEIIPPDVPFPDALLPFVEPQCEQCPPHAYCYENFEARCEPDFVLSPHPLSLGGLVPLRPSCEPDSQKALRVQQVANKAVEELRERRAKYECGELKNEDGNTEDTPSINEEELKETVSRKRSKKMNSAEFEDLWTAAIGEVTAREEIEAEPIKTPDSSAVPNRKISSTSLARISLSCSVRRTVRLGLARHRLAIGLLSFTLLGAFYLRFLYRRRVTINEQVPTLVDIVLTHLSDQKELADENENEESWLFINSLRDAVLKTTHNPVERNRIWEKVVGVVQKNSNVRITQRESNNGEVARAWEWLGPSSVEAANRRRSGRVSLAPEFKADTPQRDMVEVKKWDEPRPIY